MFELPSGAEIQSIIASITLSAEFFIPELYLSVLFMLLIVIDLVAKGKKNNLLSITTRPIAMVAVLGILFGAAYLLWSLQRVFLGKRKTDASYDLEICADGHEHIHFHDWKGKIDLDARELTMLVPLVVITIFLGIYPMPVLGMITSSVNKLVEVLTPLAIR